MSTRMVLMALHLIVLAGCAPLAMQVGTEISPQISTDVARQLNEALADHLAAAHEPALPARDAATQIYYVAADATVNIRACPTTTCDIVDQAEHGDRLSVVFDHGEWLELLLKDGGAGFISSFLASQDAPVSAEQASLAATDPPYDCVTKTCGEMDSCEEAVYKLYVCGHSARDANNDGVPCESICRGTYVPAIATRFAGIVPTDAPTLPPGAEEMGLVTRVVDGDTIDVMLNGVNSRIRYLQMNTPERDEPCYREATQANADLVAGQIVRLVPDEERVDRYDRLLRFVYVGDVLVNRALVEGGWAEVVLYPPNDAHYDEFVKLEAEAAAAGRGCYPTGIFDDRSTTR
ncbi:MAG: thermonuclease family protein [Chloroflexi bacterium]|nr:thermonuclease family protein [Chloroflexota bacterium]